MAGERGFTQQTAYRIEQDEPVGSALRRIVLGEIDLALAHLTRGADANVTVHEVRKCCKKVRAVFKLARYGLARPTCQEENRWFRDTLRHLAPSRESHVRIMTFDSLDPAVELGAIRDTLLQQRHDAMSPKTLLEGVFPVVLERFQVARGRTDVLAVDELTLPVLLRGVKSTFKRGHSALQAAKAENTSECFHDWRKWVKTLWYHTRLLADPASNTDLELLNTLDRLGTALGEDHDLADLAESLPKTVGSEDDALRTCIAERQAALKAQALFFGERIYGMKPSAFGGACNEHQH